jgi:hypothetical protein
MIISVAAVAHGQNAAGVSSPPNIIMISSDEQAWNYYVVELYDLTADPLETRNTATFKPTSLLRSATRQMRGDSRTNPISTAQH